jgi:hypothetical protein
LVAEYSAKGKQKNGTMQDVLLVKEREHVLAECGLTRKEAEYNFHVNMINFEDISNKINVSQFILSGNCSTCFG